jgi:hypothetical protein
MVSIICETRIEIFEKKNQKIKPEMQGQSIISSSPTVELEPGLIFTNCFYFEEPKPESF